MSYIAKINNTELTHIKGFRINRSKLWTEANRNMEGALRATFIGVFPKIEVTFTAMDENDLSTIVTLLDTPFFTLDWYDVKTKTYQSAQYYAGDYTLPTYNFTDKLYDEFSVSLIPVSKFVASA